MWHTDSQVLTLCVLSGLVRVPLEEQLKFGGPKAGGDDEMAHVVQTWVRVGADRQKRWSQIHTRKQNIAFESFKGDATTYLSSSTVRPCRLLGCR